MRATNITLAALTIFVSVQAHAALNFSDDLSTKTAWTAVEGGDSGYTAGLDFLPNRTGHYLSATATSQRQALLSPAMNYGPGFSINMQFDVMLHDTKAATNEPVSRVGLLNSGGIDPVAGQLAQAFVTLRKVGTIELAVYRYTDSLGNTEQIVNATGSVADSSEFGLRGYEYADWTVTRDTSGLWSLSVLNGYGNTPVSFSQSESTVATSSGLNKVYIQDLYPTTNWDGSEAAVYWDSISVSSEGNAIPEPTSLGLLGLATLAALRSSRRRRA